MITIDRQLGTISALYAMKYLTIIFFSEDSESLWGHPVHPNVTTESLGEKFIFILDEALARIIFHMVFDSIPFELRLTFQIFVLVNKYC